MAGRPGTGSLEGFYRSKAWRQFRKALIAERRDARGILACEHCGRPIVKAYDCVAHHKAELTEENWRDAEVALNPDNVVLVHFACHNEIHSRFGCEGCKRVYYVHGAPCSGKTTFVLKAAGPSDIVVDLDRIYQGISANPPHANPPRLKQTAFAVRDCLLDQIRTRAGKWQNAWVISTEALQTARARTIEALGAEEIHVEATRDECLARGHDRWLEEGGQDPSPWIDRYFRRYSE